MPLDAVTSEGLHRGDSATQTLSQLAKAYIREAKTLKLLDGERADIDKATRQAWKRQAERFWIAKNVHHISVDEFAKAVDVSRARGFDLVRYHECRDAIEKHIRQAQAAAAKNGEPYHWPGWRAALDAHLGRKGRKDASVCVLRQEVADRDDQILALTARATAAEGRLRQQFKGFMGAPGDGDNPAPQYIYDWACRNIDVPDWDVAASPTNTKVAGRFFDIEADAL